MRAPEAAPARRQEREAARRQEREAARKAFGMRRTLVRMDCQFSSSSLMLSFILRADAERLAAIGMLQGGAARAQAQVTIIATLITCLRVPRLVAWRKAAAVAAAAAAGGEFDRNVSCDLVSSALSHMHSDLEAYCKRLERHNDTLACQVTPVCKCGSDSWLLALSHKASPPLPPPSSSDSWLLASSSLFRCSCRWRLMLLSLFVPPRPSASTLRASPPPCFLITLRRADACVWAGLRSVKNVRTRAVLLCIPGAANGLKCAISSTRFPFLNAFPQWLDPDVAGRTLYIWFISNKIGTAVQVPARFLCPHARTRQRRSRPPLSRPRVMTACGEHARGEGRGGEEV